MGPNSKKSAGEEAVSFPKCVPLPIPIDTSRSDEVLLMSLFYPNNLMNSFVYRYTYNTESPLCPRCQQYEETAYHVIVECNELVSAINKTVVKIIGENAASIEHPNTLLNCSRDPSFIKYALEILNARIFRRKMEGILPAAR